MPELIADIGGTNARFALVDPNNVIRDELRLACADYPTLASACEAYLREAGGTRPRHAAIAVASPVLGDDVKMTNHHWSFSIEETRRQLRLDSLDVVNDFIAVALAVPHLTAGDVRAIGGGTRSPHGAVAVLGPGTGLGMAGLIRNGLGWTPLSSEGGHVTMAAFNEREAAVIAHLRQRFGHVSAERVISGPGLVNLYYALAALEGRPTEAGITPPEVSKRGLDRTCPTSVEAVGLFTTMLGTIAANLALTLGAQGGVFIAGGIVPQILNSSLAEVFRERFVDKGRFRGYLEDIPTFVITRAYPAFLGLAALAAGR